MSNPPASTESTDELGRRPFLAVLETTNVCLGLQVTTGDLSKASAKLGFSYPARISGLTTALNGPVRLGCVQLGRSLCNSWIAESRKVLHKGPRGRSV